MRGGGRTGRRGGGAVSYTHLLSGWNLPDCAELSGDLLRIDFEGVFFPLDDVLEAVRPFLTPESAGKIDLIDMEQWTLTRTTFAGTAMTTKTVGLNHVLDYRCV